METSAAGPHEGRRKAIIYCRISDDREGRGWGVDRQERACRRKAEALGWDVITVLIDNDISAYSGKPRPNYQRMLELLRIGEADAVLALTTRRLQRNWRDAFEFLDLVEQNDIAVTTVKGGTVDLSTADGRREARRKAIDDQHESEEIAERVRDAKADTLAAGGYRGGPRPFGFEADGVTVRESEASLLTPAAEAVLAGVSLNAICRQWKEAGVRTVARRYRQEDGSRGEPETREWQQPELRKLLLRPRNAGLMEHRGMVVGKASWPAIIEESLWRAVCSVLKDPARRTTTTNARKWLGSGLYLCGISGCPETVRCSTAGTGPGSTHQPAYRCRSGKHIVRTAATLDAFIGDLVIGRLSREDAVGLLQPADEGVDVAAADQELMAARRTLRDAAELLGAGDLDAEGYRAATAAARAREKRARELLALASRTDPLVGLVGADDVRAEWEGLDLSRQRAIVDCLMVVRIRPARRGRLPAGMKLDVESIDIEWRRPLGVA